MYDGRRRIVGIRIRSFDGEVKACVPGSSNGLFVPLDYAVKPLSPELRTSDDFPLLLLLPEGPTDAAKRQIAVDSKDRLSLETGCGQCQFLFLIEA